MTNSELTERQGEILHAIKAGEVDAFQRDTPDPDMYPDDRELRAAYLQGYEDYS